MRLVQSKENFRVDGNAAPLKLNNQPADLSLPPPNDSRLDEGSDRASQKLFKKFGPGPGS
jgi:hypothetical protein